MGASVQVQPLLPSSKEVVDTSTATTRSKELSLPLTHFFNQLVLELDGTFLSFHDLRINNTAAPRSSGFAAAKVMLALFIEVHKLPSRGTAF